MTRCILVVDDDDAVRTVIQIALERVGGWSVTAVPSGRQALHMLEHATPDLVVLDVMMPDMDGRETLKAIRQQHEFSDLAVIFATARAGPEEIAELEALDVVGVISKPFDPMTLADQISMLAGWTDSQADHDER